MEREYGELALYKDYSGRTFTGKMVFEQKLEARRTREAAIWGEPIRLEHSQAKLQRDEGQRGGDRGSDGAWGLLLAVILESF